MDIEYLISVFERKLTLQRYSASSIKNYSSSVRSFLQVAEKWFDQPDELNENEIEKYVYRKVREDHIGSSYQRFANVLFCAWTVHFIVFFFFYLYVANCQLSFSTLAINFWRYEKLLIAGDYLPKYTELDAEQDAQITT